MLETRRLNSVQRSGCDDAMGEQERAGSKEGSTSNRLKQPWR